MPISEKYFVVSGDKTLADVSVVSKNLPIQQFPPSA
jgi:hypothetical protein